MPNFKNWILKKISSKFNKTKHYNKKKVHETTESRVFILNVTPVFVILPLESETVSDKKTLKKPISTIESPCIPRQRNGCYTEGDVTSMGRRRHSAKKSSSTSTFEIDVEKFNFPEASEYKGVLLTKSSDAFNTPLGDIRSGIKQESTLLEQSEKRYFQEIDSDATYFSSEVTTEDRLLVSLQFEPKKSKVIVSLKEAYLSASCKDVKDLDTYITVVACGSNIVSDPMQTQVQKFSSKPRYNQNFTINMPAGLFYISHFSIILRIFTHRRLRSDKMIGKVELGYQGLRKSEIEHWHEAIKNVGKEITTWHTTIIDDDDDVFVNNASIQKLSVTSRQSV